MNPDGLTVGPGEPLPELMPGTVWLVGAGPGDPGLLTLLAWHALQQADAVVYDALVDSRILAVVSPNAVVEDAGKRGGRPSALQPDISNRLIVLARQGHRVVRLKGGDPFVFGRGGEEAIALREAGIPFRIVPGVTAGVGGPAYAGIPVTHRVLSQAVAFVTGHDTAGGVPTGLDWGALARIPVLVFYMGLRVLPAVARKLCDHGRPSDEPVALISKATTREQSVVTTTLGNVREAMESVPSPCLVVVGRVVDLRSQIDWFSPGA